MENCGPSAVIGGAAVVGFLWEAAGVIDPVDGGGGGGGGRRADSAASPPPHLLTAQ